jgi:uncharacterized protein (TIGR00251 family)
MPAKRAQPERVLLQIKVVPGSSRDAIAGWLGAALKVRVTAPAERGRANAAVEELVAGALGLPRASVRVVRGTTSARKTLELLGVSEAEIRERVATRIGRGAQPGSACR